ncbi:hypothetical protein QTP88_008639 [Uroleucon formosanum]
MNMINYRKRVIDDRHSTEEKIKNFEPILEGLSKVESSINNVKEVAIKTDNDIQRLIPTTTYRPRNPDVLRLLTLASLPEKNAFGINYNKLTKQHSIGKEIIKFNLDNIILKGKEREITPGMWCLLTQSDVPNPKDYTKEDLDKYKQILIETDSIYKNNDRSTGKAKSSGGDKYMRLISPIWKAIKGEKTPTTPTEILNPTIPITSSKPKNPTIPTTEILKPTILTTDILKSTIATENKGVGLMNYINNKIEYCWIDNMKQLNERLHLIAAEEKAGNYVYHNEKLGILKLFKKKMEHLIDDRKGIEYLLQFVINLPKEIINDIEYVIKQLREKIYYISNEERLGNNIYHNDKIEILNFCIKKMEKVIDIPDKGPLYLCSFISSLPKKIIKEKNEEQNIQPINELDKAAREHDYFYKNHKDTKSRHIADKILEQKALERYNDPNSSINKIFKGENNYHLNKIQLDKLKNAKEKKSGVSLEIRSSEIKNKKGGILPLIFGGIGAATALVGGVTSIVNTVNDYKHKKAMEKETIRHNKAMENKGSGLKKKKKIKKMNNFNKSSFIKNLKKKFIKIELLSNFDIIQFGNNIKIFRGCFMRDELPIKPRLNECGILNLNNSTQDGSHWVAWKKIKNKKIYFDSFGMPPPPELVKYLDKMILAKELHKPVRKKFPKRRILTKGIDDLWAADLVIMRNYSDENKDYSYIITVIDTFSKFSWALEIKKKDGINVSEAFEKIIKQAISQNHQAPKLLHADKGLEFENKHFKKVLQEYGIKMYHTQNEEKSSIIERFNRTLNSKMRLHFEVTNSKKWIKILKSLIYEYNFKDIHRSIGMRPCEVNKSNEDVVFHKLFSTKNKPKPKIKFSVARLSLNLSMKEGIILSSQNITSSSSRSLHLKKKNHNKLITLLSEEGSSEQQDVTNENVIQADISVTENLNKHQLENNLNERLLATKLEQAQK